MRTFLILTALLVAATAARGETIDEQHATLGWQTEHAPLIARVVHRGDDVSRAGVSLARCEVIEALRGDAECPAEIVVATHDTGHGAAWVEGGEHLVFLRPLDTTRFVSVSGSLGIRAIPEEGAERRFAGLVSAYLSTLDGDGAVRDPERLRELLVGWMADDDPGVVWSAALDFRRHTELHAGLTPAQRAAILDAYRAHPIGKASKRALAHALTAARPDGAAHAPLDTLGLPEATPLRGDVAEALAALGDPDATTLTVARFAGAAPALRGHLLVVLGALGDPAGAEETRRRLSDGDAGVRVQAAHAIGLIARAVRAADPEARVEGRAELVALVARGRTANERKAGTWALAQLDEPEAWAQLRRLAEEDPREDVRRHAARYLRQPRVSLILRREPT